MMHTNFLTSSFNFIIVMAPFFCFAIFLSSGDDQINSNQFISGSSAITSNRIPSKVSQAADQPVLIRKLKKRLKKEKQGPNPPTTRQFINLGLFFGGLNFNASNSLDKDDTSSSAETTTTSSRC